MATEAPRTDTLSTNGDLGAQDRARMKVRQYMEAHSASQAAVARAASIGSSTLSQFLSGTYTGDSDAVAEKLLDWMRREERRAERPSIGDQVVVETSVYRRIRSIVRLAHQERDIGVVVGEAGLGKTLALEAYEEKHPAQTLRVEVGPEYRSRGLAVELATRVGADVSSGSLYRLMQGVMGELGGTDTLVIIDQAEILPTRGLELCRRLHDVCDVGVVLAGMPKLLAHLRGSKGQLAQLYSRVGFKARVDELTDEDIGLLVQALVPGAEEGVSQAVAEVTRTTRVACKLLKRARHVAEMNDSSVTPEVVEKATQMLVIPDPEARTR